MLLAPSIFPVTDPPRPQKSVDRSNKRHRGRPRKYPEQFYQVVNGKTKYPGAKERVSLKKAVFLWIYKLYLK